MMYHYFRLLSYSSKHAWLLFLFFLMGLTPIHLCSAQTTNETLSAGSFIINMGSNNQTNNNSLRPYGLVYDLTKNNQVPIKWVINPNKGKDQADFVYRGVTYRGGTFIIPAEFRNSAVNAKITTWVNSGVVGVTTTEAITVPVYATIGTSVRWTLDRDNGDIAKVFFTRAGIPSSAYDERLPSQLNQCNDIFVMPHADPTASTHGNLVTWNNVHQGSIWVGCKAGSELENKVGKFLSNSGLVPTKHDDLKGSASYDYPADPVMQFIGTGIQNVTNQGAEQIYIPNPSWRSTTRVGVYQSNTPTPSTRRALIVYGRGFGVSNRGWVCMTAGHNLAKLDNQNSVAAIRSFFNFSLLAAIDRTIKPSLASIPSVIPAGGGTALSYTLSAPGGSFTTQWSSSCGGTFTPNATSANVTFTPPAGATSCVISVRISDACGRVFFDSKKVDIQCILNVTPTLSPVSCLGGSNGAITMAFTGSSGPYNWTWTRVSPAGTGSGSGTTISGLSAGTYQVSVTSAAGCVASFTSLIAQPNALIATATPTNYACFGQTGAMSLAISGGTPNYSVAWTGPNGFSSTSSNLTNLTAGAYQATITDIRGCTTPASATVTGPTTALTASLGSKVNVTCAGLTNGQLSVVVSGGNAGGGYTYSWGDNPALNSQNRTGLAPGAYTVTVTDANGCTTSLTETISVPNPLVISVAKVDPTCPPGADPSVGNNGSLNITVTGGTGAYTYAWTTLNGSGLNPSVEDQANLTAGTYAVTVTDGNGCTQTLSVTLANVLPFPSAPIKINN